MKNTSGIPGNAEKGLHVLLTRSFALRGIMGLQESPLFARLLFKVDLFGDSGAEDLANDFEIMAGGQFEGYPQ